MINFEQALFSLRPNGDYVIDGESNYKNLKWRGNDKPTEDEIKTEITRLQAEYDSKQYQRDRSKEYPSIQEQLDMQYWDSVNGTTTWQDAINAVKAKYPKGA